MLTFLQQIYGLHKICSNRYRQDEDEEEVRQRLRIMHCVMQLSGMLGAHLDLSLPTITITITIMIIILIIIVVIITLNLNY